MAKSWDFTTARRSLLKAGFYVVPAQGKRILLHNWTQIRATEAMITRWAEQPGAKHPNTGVLTFNTPAIDIDVTDAGLSQWVYQALLAGFGLSSAVYRIGLPPKLLVPFRTDQPFKKRALTFAGPDGVRHKVEVLGDGQQFIADGKHPDTKHPYEWYNGDLVDATWAGLPEINEAKADDFLKLLKECLANHGTNTVFKNGIERPTVGDPNKLRPDAGWAWNTADADYFRNEVLTRIPGDICYDDWFTLACGLGAKDQATAPDCEIGWLLFYEWCYRWAGTITTKTPEDHWKDVMRRGWALNWIGPGSILELSKRLSVDGLDTIMDEEVSARLKAECARLKIYRVEVRERQASERREAKHSVGFNRLLASGYVWTDQATGERWMLGAGDPANPQSWQRVGA
jgi:hypothetical protein